MITNVFLFQRAIESRMNKISIFDGLIAPVLGDRDKKSRKHYLRKEKDVCQFIGGVHAMSTGSMIKIYHLMIKHEVVDLSSSKELSCIEFGCGIPYFAVFLSLMGLNVNAIDLPDGMVHSSSIIVLPHSTLSPSNNGYQKEDRCQW